MVKLESLVTKVSDTERLHLFTAYVHGLVDGWNWSDFNPEAREVEYSKKYSEGYTLGKEMRKVNA